MNCCSVVPGVLSVSRTRASRACSATRSRSWSTGWAKRMIRSTRAPDAAATCSGVSPARMRDWMTRGGSSVPRSTSIWVSRRESPRAAARSRSSTGSAKCSSPSSVSATRSRLEPSSESPTRRSVRTGDLLQGVSGRAPERDRSRGYRRAPAARRRLRGAARPRRPPGIGPHRRTVLDSATMPTGPSSLPVPSGRLPAVTRRRRTAARSDRHGLRPAGDAPAPARSRAPPDAPTTSCS